MSRATRPPVRFVHVVVPAHNEEVLVEHCLRGLRAAMDAADSAQVETRCTLVLDHCEDQTAIRARPHLDDPRFRVLTTHERNVGRARDLGVRSICPPAGSPAGGIAEEQVWVMSTDADTVVPEQWVRDHLEAAADHDLVVGAVVPEPEGLTPALVRAWHRDHAPTRSVVHVHGANLGFRLSTYLEAGGFAPVAEHEDVAFVRAVRALDRPWCRATTVTTSSRRVGRAPGGFAGYMRALAARAT